MRAATSLAGSRGRRAPIVETLAVGVIASIATASAVAKGDTRDLRWEPALDGVLVGASAVGLVTSELLEESLVPAKCRWCEPDGLDDAAREALVWTYPSRAASISNAIAFGLAPASAALTLGLAANHERALGREGVEDVVLVGEATLLAIDLDQIAKFTAARQRPFAYALGDAERDRPAHPDDDLSFFSGHTTATFALAASTGTVATMRGYRWAPLTWALGGALAVTTGYLRIAADKHWLTDVLTGAVVGTAVGILVPLVFHGREGEPRASPPATPSAPASAALSFVW